MLEWLNTFAGWIARPEVRAILVGLIISWNGTQLVKNAPALTDMAEWKRRLGTRAIAFAFGFAPAFVLWPGGHLEAAMYGAATGLAAPTIYTYGARVLYFYFPWLEAKMSAEPVKTINR